MVNIKNRFIILFLMFFVIMSFSTVYASDNSTVDSLQTNAVDEPVLTTEYEIKDMMQADSLKSFTDLNSEIQYSGTNNIKLSGNYNYSSSDSQYRNGIELRSNIIIDGQDKTVIDGSGQARVFVANGVSNVTIKNLIIVNSVTNNANGIIYFSGSVSNINIDATFKDNAAIRTSGMITFEDSATNIKIKGTFENNNARDGGVVYFKSASDVEISGTFINNTAISNGGVIYFDSASDVKIKGTFRKNHANVMGGVVYVHNTISNMNIEGTFENNTGVFGSGIYINYANDVSISGDFVDNSASTDASVIYFAHDSSNVNISGNFIHNNALLDGGAINFQGTSSNVTVKGNFSNNAAGAGGAIYFNNVKDSLINASFTNNKATYGGAIYFGNAENLIIASDFANNIATEEGGAINIQEGDNIQILDSTFTNNTADTGAGIYSY